MEEIYAEANGDNRIHVCTCTYPVACPPIGHKYKSLAHPLFALPGGGGNLPIKVPAVSDSYEHFSEKQRIKDRFVILWKNPFPLKV